MVSRPSWLSPIATLGLLASLCIFGCGEAKVTLSYDGDSPAPLQTQAPVVSKKPMSPTSLVTQPPSPSPSPSPTPPVATVATPEPATSDFRVYVDYAGEEFFPRVRVELEKPDGTPVTADFVSEDGLGLNRNLGRVRIGDYYRMKVFSLETPEAPFFNKVLKFTRDTLPRFALGSVRFVLPKALAFQLNAGMKVTIKCDPTGELVLQSKLGEIKAYSVYGDAFPMTVVLGVGTYRYAIEDVDAGDGVDILSTGGSLAEITESKNTFVISAKFPQAILDLTPVFSK